MKAIHDKQGCGLKGWRKYFALLFVVLHKLDYISSETILVDFEGKRWAFGVFDNSHVVCSFRLSKHKHMGHSKYASS